MMSSSFVVAGRTVPAPQSIGGGPDRQRARHFDPPPMALSWRNRRIAGGMTLARVMVMNAVATIGIGATLGLMSLACSGGTPGSTGMGGTGGVLTGDGPGTAGGARVGQRDAGAAGLPAGSARAMPAAGNCRRRGSVPAGLRPCFETGARASSGYMVEPKTCAPGDLYVHVEQARRDVLLPVRGLLGRGRRLRGHPHAWMDAVGNVVARGRRAPLPTGERTSPARRPAKQRAAAEP